MGADPRILPYPVLEEDNLAWPQGRYRAVITSRPDCISATVSHGLSEAPFLERILQEGRAEYACSVAVPITSYRKLHSTGDANQTVSWEENFCGEPPLLRPMIIATEEIRHVFRPEDGVSEIWQGQESTIPRGARLALDEYQAGYSSSESLIDIVLDKDMKSGSFRIEASTEKGYYFKAHVASDLHQFLLMNQERENSISTHMASRCLEILARDFGDSKNQRGGGRWEIYPNLKRLAGWLEQAGYPLWDDEESFSADEVATKIYSHPIPSDKEQEE